MSPANTSARPSYASWLLLACLVLAGALLLYVRSSRTSLIPSGPARSLSGDQARLLRQELAKHPAHSLTVKTDPSDGEAKAFAQQLYDTLRNSEWHVDLSMDNTGPGIGTGLCIAQTGEDERPAYPDPSQDPYFFLPNALEAAHIDLGAESGQSSGDYKLYLVVGHRELKPAARPRGPTLRGGARWFLSHVRKALRRI